MPNNYRIGILGLANSGKTTLLTSLLAHLFHHEPSRFALAPDQNARISRVRETRESEKAGDSRFPYEKYLQHLRNQRRFPEKTRDLLRFSLEFSRSGWWFDASLNFVDLPGERFADAAMCGRDFNAWSDETLKQLDAGAACLKSAETFLDLQQLDPPPGPEELVTAYRQCLADMMYCWRPLITPSTFWLGADGSAPSSEDAPAVWAKTRFAGLDAERQFAPVGAGLRARRQSLEKAFSPLYEEYKKSTVEPMFSEMVFCDALAVLIDIPAILASGVNTLNDTAAILSKVAWAVQPPGGWRITVLMKDIMNFIMRPLNISFRNLRRIAFVAGKSDMMRWGDQQKLKSLLEHTASGIKTHVKNVVKMRDFTCSAIVSTEWGDDTLQGIPKRHADGAPYNLADGPVALGTSPLPFAEWPSLPWDPGQFVFPEVRPAIPAFINDPPAHENLDKLFNFLLGMD